MTAAGCIAADYIATVVDHIAAESELDVVADHIVADSSVD